MCSDQLSAASSIRIEKLALLLGSRAQLFIRLWNIARNRSSTNHLNEDGLCIGSLSAGFSLSLMTHCYPGSSLRGRHCSRNTEQRQGTYCYFFLVRFRVSRFSSFLELFQSGRSLPEQVQCLFFQSERSFFLCFRKIRK